MPLDPASVQLAERLGARASICEVVTARRLSPSIYEVVLHGEATTLAGVAGNDVMIRLADAKGRAVRRRYSVRALDKLRDEFTLWVTVDHEGPGTTWVTSTESGDAVDVIGPRGKILLDPEATWHLFVGDASALGVFYRMAATIDPPGKAIVVAELDDIADALGGDLDPERVRAVYIERRGRATDDPSGLFRALGDVALPEGPGHAYLFGEFHVMRVLEAALLDRGLKPEEISHKAFWRSGRSNAEHGEPERTL